MEKYKILKVTKIEHYFIPMGNEAITQINGWSIKETVKNWFENRPINEYHATINAHNIGHASYVKEVEIVDDISMDKDNPLIMRGIK